MNIDSIVRGIRSQIEDASLFVQAVDYADMWEMITAIEKTILATGWQPPEGEPRKKEALRNARLAVMSRLLGYDVKTSKNLLAAEIVVLRKLFMGKNDPPDSAKIKEFQPLPFMVQVTQAILDELANKNKKDAQ